MINKRVKIKRNFFLFFFLVISVAAFAYVAFAGHSVGTSAGGTSFNVAEDVQFAYNISVNNTAGQTANITQLNITLNNTFVFISNSNGSDAFAVFTNTSSVLSWTNATPYLINESQKKYFWFNATASTPGNYNFTIMTLNVTGAYYSNISITVNDTTAPNVSLNSPSAGYTNNSASSISVVFNCSVTDNYALSNISLFITNAQNASFSLNKTTNFSGTSGSANWTLALGNGNYTWNCLAYDSAGQSDWGNANRSISTQTSVSTNFYIADFSFSIPDSVYNLNENISLKGKLYLANYTSNGTLVFASSAMVNANVNITIENENHTYAGNYILITDSNGKFKSKNNHNSNNGSIPAPSSAGNYNIIASYVDPNNTIWSSTASIKVVSQSLDMLDIRPEKVAYNPLETIKVKIYAMKQIGDKILYVSNIDVNGSLRNSTQGIISRFNCTTGANGECSVSVSAPSSYGTYNLELNNFKAFSSFYVTPFSYTLYIKDEFGESTKNLFARGEQARVDVSIINASTDDSYSFSGYIVDSSGNVVKIINSTILNNNNSFSNGFLFTADALTFNYGTYRAAVTIVKAGDGNISASASFEIEDWALTINKKDVNSGFEYELSTFPNKTTRFEIYPTYRSNGSIIAGINESSFSISLKDALENVLGSANTSWNASCGKSGCYEFFMNTPESVGQYNLYASLSYSGSTQTEIRGIDVIGGIMSAQSTNANGDVKELFGTTDYVYLSLSAYNQSSASFNLSDAEVLKVNYMNGSEISYAQTSFSLVNSTNSGNEWGWNSTLQMLKLDVPRVGGIYNVFIYGNNRTLGINAMFIVNPYDACSTPKNTLSGNNIYYVWQFKKTDTIYFDIKLTQANNPLGRATAVNGSGNSSLYGQGSVCNISSNQQAISNATLTINEVRNTESGAVQSFNTSASSCQASDNSGGYSCTLQPLSKWEGGGNTVKFNILGQDGTTDFAMSRFEARAFYMYGYSTQWQNSPTNNISLSISLYEAGDSWWDRSGGSVSGTVVLKKIEYQGRDGEWLYPPVDASYNTSAMNSSNSITNGSGTMTVPSQYAAGGNWKTGYYRAVLQATTTAGDIDYGYAWFGVKLWDVYANPVECTTAGCTYKSYFNSKENITLYAKISQAGNYYGSDNGGADIGGNITIRVKKIQDCRRWPCKDLNSSTYSASSINVNQSSPWYWNTNAGNQSSKYIIQINSTTGRWNTGYYSVTLDVNGTDTGSAWFNAIAFYVETQPTDNNGTNYIYSIRPTKPMYFNVSSVKSYKSWCWWGGCSRYNISDYVNTTIDSLILRTWDYATSTSREYTYGTANASINVTSTAINGNSLLNLTFLNTTTGNRTNWPSGWYSGELSLKNADNETSTGWLWFEVKPFRVDLQSVRGAISGNSYNIDSEECVNATAYVYEPGWNWPYIPVTANYTITSVFENIWSMSGNNPVTYTNYTTGIISGNGSNIRICPNGTSWGSGSWGGYHYLNVYIRNNDTQESDTGWLSFKTVPFQINWNNSGAGYSAWLGSKSTGANINVSVAVTKTNGTATRGNLTKISQWRYDSSTNYMSVREEYNFSVGSCSSWISRQCVINGTQNVTIYAPSNGWKVGYNSLYAEWVKENDASIVLQDWSGISFDGKESYNGYFSNSDANGNYKYYFDFNENFTIKIYVRDMDYNNVGANVTNVQYAYSDSGCYSDWCMTYNSATWSVIGGGASNGISSSGGIITIKAPSGGWNRGQYTIKATVSVGGNTATITSGYVRARDSTPINITISSPANNATINASVNGTMLWSATTTKNAQCSLGVYSYDNFYNWYCGGWNSTNSTNGSISNQTLGACNITRYNYAGNNYYSAWISENYFSSWDGVTSTWSSASTGLLTGTTSHRYNLNVTNMTSQNYGIYSSCYDADYNYVTAFSAIKVAR